MVDPTKPASGIAAFVREFVGVPGVFSPIAGDGSKRIFWRIRVSDSNASYIAMENAPTDAFLKRENAAYLNIGRHLRQKGLPLPEIYRFDLEKGWFLMEDFGDVSLQTACLRSEERLPIYLELVEILFQQQTKGAEGFHAAWTCQTETYDRRVMRQYEADYFKESFLGSYLGVRKKRPDLEKAFDHLIEEAGKAENHFFLHRDFQSRNIMIAGEKIGILDWQGGRFGPLAYDLASLVIDPYTNLPNLERVKIYDAYHTLLRRNLPGCLASFERAFPYLAIQRNLQILGAFSFLSRVRGKTYFEEYIPAALRSLRHLLDELRDENLRGLRELVDSLPDSGRGPNTR